MVDVRGEPALGLRERKKRRTRDTLINAAVGLCESQGFDGTTVDQIAAIADVSPRTFSRYFATKDAIVLALIDDVLDLVAGELERQPLALGNYEALRRAYVAMALRTQVAGKGELSSDRLLQIMRILVSSPTLRMSALEFRGNPVDVVVARRMGVAVDDRRVQLVSVTFGAVLMTALTCLVDRGLQVGTVGVDDAVAVLEATYAEFESEMAGYPQPV
ncbi:transcriptional regulator [Mycolicibacterium chubuense NBB4]|uniref:Transcriptional regulator n=1 Tax=Mycolicibacterium chubuense (strain NBB4) TaxID=710421 RepID=I4BPA1_MYCCN|nr:TetR family transcriptional regulator [Mycolicibacterium chubuense]AFM19108.1 transcriptional regulator [Mycolicibacterium chubuense NBB4]